MSDTAAFFDARCPSCGARYGWYGTADAAPHSCRSCGYDLKAQREAHAQDAASIGEMMERRSTPANQCDGEKLRAKRIDAGLTLRQAANLLDTTMTRLSHIEQGRATANDVLTRRMDRVYGGEQ